MKLTIPQKIIDYFDSYKNKYNKFGDNYNSQSNLVIGKLWWINPDNVLWLYSTNNEEYYEGSQTQFGITKEGDIVWAFFSHCSCYGYEDYKGEFNKLSDENQIHTNKTYELENVDKEVLNILKDRIRQISKLGLKDEIKEAVK